MTWSSTHAQEQRILLDVLFNGQRLNRIGEFREQSGQIYARISEWRDYGVFLPLGAGAEDEWRSSTQLPKVKVTVDREKLLIWIEVDPEDRPVQSIRSKPCCGMAIPATVSSAQGAVLNYDLLAQRYSGYQSVAGALDGRVFGPGWIAGSTGLYLGRFVRPAQWIRLDSQYTLLDPDRMRRVVLGDFISQSVSWSRPVRMAGLRVSSDFSMRPDLITFPVPSLQGLATVPSTVDVLVNNVRLLSNPVEAGPFEIRQLPVFSGSGNVNLVVRDALGRETVQTLAFYTSPQMLAPGLSSFSVEMGKLRINYGLQSNDYITPAISTTYRYGLHARATVEAHAEGARGLVSGGGSLIWNFGAFGMAAGSFAYSENRGQGGHLLGLSYERQATPFSFSAAVTRTSSTYADLATRLGQGYPRLLARVFAGWSLQRWGNLSLGYSSNTEFTAIRSSETPSLASDPLSGLNRSGSFNKLLTLSYTRSVFNNTTFYLTGFRNKSASPINASAITQGKMTTSGIMFGLTLALDNRTSSSLTHTHESRGSSSNLSINRPAIDPGDLGWRLYDQKGWDSRFVGAVEYKSSLALMRLSVDQSPESNHLQAELSGAIGMIGSQFFASNRIDDSFAMVDTSLPHMRILIENRDAGQSDANARLLVPNLRAYDTNTLSFDTRQLTLDYDLETTSYLIRPQERSGMLLRFNVRNDALATATLVRASGAILEAGSLVEYGNPTQITVVGFAGKVYLRQLSAHNQLTVRTPSGVCHVEFAYTPVAGTIPELGPLACR